MNLSQKMMLVPAGRPAPEVSELSALDQAMSNILNNRNISNIEKINLYQKVLRKNLAMENNLNQKYTKQERKKTRKPDSSFNKDDSIDYTGDEELVINEPEIKQEIEPMIVSPLTESTPKLSKNLKTKNESKASLTNSSKTSVIKKDYKIINSAPEIRKYNLNPKCTNRWAPYCLRNKRSPDYEHIYPASDYEAVIRSIKSRKKKKRF